MKTILRLFTLLLLVAVAVDASAQGQPLINIRTPNRVGNRVYIPVGIKNIGDQNLRGEIRGSMDGNPDRRTYVIGSDSIDYYAELELGTTKFNIPPGVWSEDFILIVNDVPYDLTEFSLVKVALNCYDIPGNTNTRNYSAGVSRNIRIMPMENTEGDSVRCSIWSAHISGMKCTRSGKKATLSFQMKNNFNEGTLELPEWDCFIIGKDGTRYPAKFTQSSSVDAGQSKTFTVEISDIPSDLTELAYALLVMSQFRVDPLTIEFWNIPVKKMTSAPTAPRKKPGKKRKR
ncbi:MAG: hypothetical protein J6C77_01200 [Muribaculaceae bacterium]|nr:hypothetical protein [Muribaculaceae bacterium]